MEEIVIKEKCTGCTACMNICPKNAITMEIDSEGFRHPIIDQNKCINCGLCKKICPVLNSNKNESLNKCYAGYAKEDKIKEKTSSGGIFPLIANYILDNNGIVIGAAFDKDNKLNHIAITKKKDLDKLKGSKYLQSNLDNIFKYIKINVKEKKILFVGTPCQVAGLKAFLQKDFDNLICIDLVCHGVPSPMLFDKYVKELEEKNKDKLLDYNFRDKNTGWDNYSNTATFKNKKISDLQSNNDYMKLFLSNVALRESCYNCNFKLGNKYSDITLGDFWGVQKYYSDLYNKKGVSAIIINTPKGEEIFNNIIKEIKYEECKLEEILSYNQSLKESSEKPIGRNEFFNEIKNISINALTKKYVKKPSLYQVIKNILKHLK